jgi:hypothetical protein
MARGLGSIADIADASADTIRSVLRNIDLDVLKTTLRNFDLDDVSIVLRNIEADDLVSKVMKNLDTDKLVDIMKQVDGSNLKKMSKSLADDTTSFKKFLDAADSSTINRTMKSMDDAVQVRVMKNMGDADLKKLKNSMDASDLDRLKALDPDLSRRLDEIAGTAVGAAAKNVSEFCKKHKVLCAAPFLYGGAKYIQERGEAENEEREANVRNCIGICLPNGWDAYTYDGAGKDTLEYKTRDDIEFELGPGDEPIDWEKQPLCTENEEDCGEFCTNKCEEIFPKPDDPMNDLLPDLPDNPLDPRQWLDSLRSAINGILQPLFDIFGFLNADVIMYICLGICCLFLLMMFMG